MLGRKKQVRIDDARAASSKAGPSKVVVVIRYGVDYCTVQLLHPVHLMNVIPQSDPWILIIGFSLRCPGDPLLESLGQKIKVD